MSNARLISVIVPILAAAGCATRTAPVPATHPAEARPLAATRPVDPKALLTLAQLEPKLDAPKARPATSPAVPAPLDAIELYAAARDATLTGRRQTAVDLLEKAAALDPQSFEIRTALGKAYVNGAWDERSLASLLKAAEIDPDHVELQADIGRQLLAKGDWAEGVRHLRLALLASDAKEDAASLAVAELQLSKALRDGGYDTAAVELLERVRGRIASPSLDVRMNPELFFHVSRPEFLATQAGQLYERLGRFDEALAVYRPLAEADPSNFESRARLVRTMVNAGRADEAAAAAADAVTAFRASSESLKLLRDVYAAIGREGQAAAELRKLHEAKPDDRSLLYALSDLLSADGKYGEAAQQLERASQRNPEDFEIVRRLVALGQEAHPETGAASAAARLVRWSADHPDAIHQTAGLWTQLVRPRPEGRVRPSTIRSVDLGKKPSARLEAARLLWVARVARAAARRDVEREALAQAVALEGEPFAPAYRAQVDSIWSRGDRSDDEKGAECEQLAARATRLGDASLAAEVHALSLLNQDKPADALPAFDLAAKLGGKSPDLQLGRALAARKTGDTSRFEQLLWKLIGDWPQYDDGYEALYSHYASTGAGPLADKVMAQWQSADPQSVSCRLTRVRRYFAAGNPSAAERLLLDVFDDAPGDPTVNVFLQTLFRETNRLDDLAKRYRTKLAEDPADLAVASELADLETERGKPDEAVRGIDGVRSAIGDGDADALYAIAHLYQSAGRADAAERALRDALRAEPSHGPAANDLGYALADRGEQMDEAERLVRLGVASEPDNAAFLDSLGWVLYKRGRFAEAGVELGRALAASRQPDPVTLDHLGDAQYRAGMHSEAAATWKSAAERLAALPPPGAADRDDLKALKSSLALKSKQAATGEAVTVAPVVEEPVAAPQSQAKRQD